MQDCQYNGHSIFNYLDGQMPDIIESFVAIYGENIEKLLPND